MSNLLIIGNGFDIAHGLETRYKHFRKFLYSCATEKEYAEDAIIENPEVPNVHIYTKGEVLYSLKEDCKYLFAVIDDAARKEKQPDLEWNKFEELLGKLNHCKVLEENSYDELVFMGIRDSLGTLENVFFEWIKTITIDKISKIKFLESFIDPKKDLMVNFNYTETAEVVYGIEGKNICYIHGKREMETKLREKYHMTSFGAGNRRLVVGYDGSKYNPQEKYSMSKDSDKYSMLVTLDTGLIKNTEEVLYDNRECFKRIGETDIQNILSFGFSFSEVDKPQIEAICKALNRGEEATKEMTWYLNSYDNAVDENEDRGVENRRSKNERFKEYIKECGFLGEFEIYNSDEVYVR